jgi:hypothetical protein
VGGALQRAVADDDDRVHVPFTLKPVASRSP